MCSDLVGEALGADFNGGKVVATINNTLDLKSKHITGVELKCVRRGGR